jgi:hypothetical protein
MPALSPFSAAFHRFRARGWLLAGLPLGLVSGNALRAATDGPPTAIAAQTGNISGRVQHLATGAYLEGAQVNQVSTPCDLTGTWINKGAAYSLTQNGTSVEFRYDTDTVEHYGSGIYEEGGRRVVLNLTRVANGCQLNGTVAIEIVSCSELRHMTRWDAGCDLPQGLSEEGMSRRSP